MGEESKQSYRVPGGLRWHRMEQEEWWVETPWDGMEPSSGTMFLAEETAKTKRGDSNVLSDRTIQASRAGSMEKG